MKTWILSEEGTDYDSIEAESIDDAYEIVSDNADRSNYPDAEPRTIWVRVGVRCEATGERRSGYVALDPEEPECPDDVNHDWQSPYEILGGLKENPGVRGHGGGVIVSKVCMYCGCERVTDTWAQNPENGEQGLRSVEYHEGRYSEEVIALAEEAS